MTSRFEQAGTAGLKLDAEGLAGTHEKGGQDLGGPGIGSSEHIGEDAATHHREDDACADHAMHAQSGGGVIGDAPRHRG